LQGGKNTTGVHTAGKVGTGAFAFDGSADRVKLDSKISLTGNFAVAFWLRLDDANIHGITSYLTGYPTQDFLSAFGNATDAMLWESVGNNTHHVGVGEVVDTIGVWTHWVIQRDGTDLQCYKNGRYVDHDDNGVGGTYHVRYLGYGYGNKYLDGDLDDMRVFGRVLTIREIKGLYNQGAGLEDCSVAFVLPPAIGVYLEPIF